MINLLRKVYRKIFPYNENGISKSAIIVNSLIERPSKISQHSYIYNSKIHSYTYLAGFNSVMNTTIGKFCSIGDYAIIGAGNHPTDFISSAPAFYSPHKQCNATFADKSYFEEMKPTFIGNDVWIGAFAIIMTGVTIGDGAIIAAGSFVNKDVKPYEIVGGTPAKFIRKRFSDEEIEKLLHFKWWDKEETWLQENFIDFHNKDNFFKKFF